MNPEFKKSTTAEDLNERTKVAQKKIEAGEIGAREAHFELNKLAENADDFRDEFDQEKENWDKLHPKQEIKKEEPKNILETKKADIERRRREELELMLKKNAVEINENNFDFELVGGTAVFDTTAYFKKDKIKDIDFYQMFYDGGNYEKSFSLVRRNSGKIIYVYNKNHLISGTGRTGSFFGMSIELNDIYCTDFEKLESFLDQIFDDLIINRYHILEKTNDSELPYRFNIDTFNSKKIEQVVAEIKAIILKNFKNKDLFGEDFRNVDENFKNFIKEKGSSSFIILHEITNITTYTNDKEITKTIIGNIKPMNKKDVDAAITKETNIKDVKPFDSNYFDFDRNAINAKYNKELVELEEIEKSPRD